MSGSAKRIRIWQSEKVPDSYVTTGYAAKALGVGLTTLQRWAHAGLVTPAFTTPGGHFRWDLDDLRAQLQARPDVEREADREAE
jgi:excisionase family DNA binding protein